ncbi:MAG: MmcQ/YjbR family DNA-binding protein [Planctomycetes bacterium]|nr:MmcQ/YjbR family DNA-binding protein [Planctomycetota bacterium]
MDAARFRTAALALDEVEEGAHQGHPDFRVRGKIFASLAADDSWAMVKLPPEEQAARIAAQPEVFEAFRGAWGRAGCTKVHLVAARVREVEQALRSAWTNVRDAAR